MRIIYMVGQCRKNFQEINLNGLNEDFIKYLNEESDEWYSLEVDIQYPEKLHELHSDLPFLPERMEFERVRNWLK